jgi:hypothetical protein
MRRYKDEDRNMGNGGDTDTIGNNKVGDKQK